MGQTADTHAYEEMAKNQIERRRSTRMLIEIPVTLATASDLHKCHMTNISDAGAMLETPAPPNPGIAGRLVMGDDVVECQVVWSRHQMCGIKFNQNLGAAKLGSITSETGKAQGKVGSAAQKVARAKAAFGRKRTSLVASED